MATDIMNSTVLLARECKILAGIEAKAGNQSIRAAAAAVVFVVDNGGDKPAQRKARVGLDEFLGEATVNAIMAWVNKAVPIYGKLVTGVADFGPEHSLKLVIEHMILRDKQNGGNGKWDTIRAEFRKTKAPGNPDATKVTDGTSNPVATENLTIVNNGDVTDASHYSMAAEAVTKLTNAETVTLAKLIADELVRTGQLDTLDAVIAALVERQVEAATPIAIAA